MAQLVFYLGKAEPLLEHPVALFQIERKPTWLESELGKNIIQQIDKSEVLSSNVVRCEALGTIPVDWLSSGCKGVLLAAFYEGIEGMYLDGSKLGDNCFPVLFDVAETTGRALKIRVGRLLREPWDDRHEVLFMPKKVLVKGYKNILHYMGLHTHMFYRGDGFGKA